MACTPGVASPTEADILHFHHRLENPEDVKLPLKKLILETLWIALPADVSCLLWMISQTVTMMFVGNFLGESALSYYSAGLMVFNVCGMSVIAGLGSSVETICSQVYGKDPDSAKIGETALRVGLLSCLAATFMSIFFVFSEPALVFCFGDDIGRGSAQFLARCPAYLFCQIIGGVLSKSFYATRHSKLVACTNVTSALLSPLLNYWLTRKGLGGAAATLTLISFINDIAYVLFCMFYPTLKIRNGTFLSWSIFQKHEWHEILKLGIPSTIAVCAEWWAFEIQTIIVIIFLTKRDVACFGVGMNIVSCLFSVALGQSVAASTIIGNSLGANKPMQAKQFSRFVLLFALIVSVLTFFVVSVFGGHIARLYSKDPEVVEVVESAMIFVVLVHCGDSIQFCLQGIYRGAGCPKQAATTVLFTLWLVGIPASLFYNRVLGWGVKGAFCGLLTGFLTEVPLLTYRMFQWDWDQLALTALRRHRPDQTAASVRIVYSESTDPLQPSDCRMEDDRMSIGSEEHELNFGGMVAESVVEPFTRVRGIP